MKVILYMAMSVNGLIARENGDEDFLSETNYQTFVGLAHKSGCMIWGRKTHEAVRNYERDAFKPIEDIKKIVVSRNIDFQLEDGFEIVKSPKKALDKLNQQGFKEVILTGGSSLNSSFAKENLIDEVILNIQSIIVGEGVPLFSPENFELALKLKEVKKVSNEIIQLHYIVNK
jgi:dihydrofolate reductase